MERTANADPRRILVRGVNWLGDAVMSTPALLRLRECFPAAHITLLTPAKLQDIWQQHPAVDSTLSFADGEGVWSVGRRLRAEKFDLALVLPNSPRSALEVWLAGIPRRVGHARPWRNWLLTQAVPPRQGAVPMQKRSKTEIENLIRGGAASSSPLPANAHHLYQYLHLTAALGAKPEPLPPQLVVSDEAVAQFAAKFGLTPTPSGYSPWFGLNAGAEYGPAKRWPEERFINATIEIQRRTQCRWLIFGLPSEQEAAAHIAAGVQGINLAGRTSLGELCAGLKVCQLLLTNDSGPMHVAAAVGTPVVVPFGSTSPELTGPGLPGDPRHQLLRARVPCSPCFLRECPIDFRCMKNIAAADVVAAVLQVVS